MIVRDPADHRARRRTADGDVVDAIARAVFGAEGGGAVERLLAANPGLAELGAVLDAGVELALPPAAPAEPDRPLRLWS